ncbi:MAG TPA: SprT-like domain-containing protein [Chitinophagaceae bacterium]|nr:SprT-like domain-containing protein [Chitinophagaceae bacterium]
MAATEHPMHALAGFLPEGTFDQVVAYLHQYKVHLTLTKERKSVLGDYRNAVPGKNHRISVNQTLNKYAFLITLLHELAHLLTFEKYGHRVMSHGKEWKQLYSHLLATFVQHDIFPHDIKAALQHSIANPAASSCAEEGLMRVLRKYDDKKPHVSLLEELPPHAWFKTADGRIFQKMEKLRKRYRCQEIKTGLIYLFSPIYEVQQVSKPGA